MKAHKPSTKQLAVVRETALSVNPRELKPKVVAELQRLVGVVAELQAASHANTTIQRYQKQWNRFAEWCSSRGLPAALPVPVELVMLYVADWATTASPPANSTITQALAAIDWVHGNHKLPPPRSPELNRLRKGLRNRLGVAPKRKAAPLLLEHLVPLGRALLAPTPTQLRDALILTLRAYGLSYGEITALVDTDVLELDSNAVVLRVRQQPMNFASASTPEGLCTLLSVWMEARGSWTGPLLCRISSTEEIQPQSIPVQSIRSVLLKHAKRAGIVSTSAGDLSQDDLHSLVQLALKTLPSRVRDLACILLLWAGALRSDELVHVRVRHLKIDQQGLTLTIPRSKTDQSGKGMTAFVPRGERDETNVVAAVERWLALLASAGATNDNFIFCRIDRHENLILLEEKEAGVLQVASATNGQRVTDTLRKSLANANLPGLRLEEFSSHSGKRGIATQLAKSKVGASQIAEVTRHKSLQSVKGYVDDELLRAHSALQSLGL